MADGYGAGLFDAEGPKAFATAVGTISKNLGDVGTSFTKFGTTAQTALGGISGAVDQLMTKLSSLQNSLSGGVGATVGGMGAAAPAASPGGGSGGTGAPTPAWSQAAAPQPDAKTGAGTPLMPPASPQNAPTTFPQQQQGTASMGQRAMQSMVPAAIGAASNYGGSMISTAIQGATIGQIYAPAFGVSSRSLYTIPQGTLAQNPAAYAQSNYYAMMNMGVAPGTQNWSSIQGQANNLMTLIPNLSRQQAMQTQQSEMSPGNLNAGMRFGFNFSPGGKMETGTQEYAQVFQRLAQGTGGKPTGAQVEAWMRPGAAWASNIAQLGWTPGSADQIGFMNYALTRVGVQSQGGTLGNGGTSLQGTRLTNNPAYSQLTAESSRSQVESQAEPSLAQAAKDLNDASAHLLGLASPFASLLGGGSAAGMTGSLGSLAVSGVGLYGATKVAGKLGSRLATSKLGSSMISKASGGIGGLLKGRLGSIFKGAGAAGGEEAAAGGLLEGAGGVADATGVGLPVGLALGAAGLGVMAAPAIGHAVSGVGHWLGGLFGGSPAGASTPSSSSDANNSAVSSLLTSKAPTNSLLACLTQPIKKSDNSLASALVYGTSGGSGSTGGAGAGGGGGGSSGGGSSLGWNYQTATSGPVDASSSYSVGAGFQSRFSGSGGGSTSAGGTSSTPAAGGSIPSSGTLTSAQVQQAWIQAGGPANVAKTMAGIAQAESGSQPSNVQKGEPPGLTGWGLWQITPTSGITQNGKYGNLLDPINNAKAALALYKAAGNSLRPWAGDHYLTGNNIDPSSSGVSYARGTQRIARTQLAMLHQGEAVVPAADNYSSRPYNRGGAANASSSSVQLNFKSGSVVLQVPAGSTQQDMANIANQFVAAISKPAVLASVRSQ